MGNIQLPSYLILSLIYVKKKNPQKNIFTNKF